MAKGSEDNFQLILAELNKSIRAYETHQIKFMQHMQKTDDLFGGYGWSKKDFYQEMNARLGISTNETRAADKIKKPATKKKKAAVKKDISHLPALSEVEKDDIRNGAKIQAIKEYRTRTGCGLKEAKDLCDIYAESLIAF